MVRWMAVMFGSYSKGGSIVMGRSSVYSSPKLRTMLTSSRMTAFGSSLAKSLSVSILRL